MSSDHVPRWWGLGVGLCMLLAMTGCDNTPNPQFEQQLKAKQASADGDTYAPLSAAPRLQMYGYWKPDDRQANAGLEAQKFSRTFDSMLAQLDTEKMEPGIAPLVAGCRAVFKQVLEFRSQGSKKPVSANSLSGQAILNDLGRCRDQALAARESNAKQAHLLSDILRRFSSSGMVLVAVSMIAHGDEEKGLEIWKTSDPFIDDDKASFKLSLQAFRGW